MQTWIDLNSVCNSLVKTQFFIQLNNLPLISQMLETIWKVLVLWTLMLSVLSRAWVLTIYVTFFQATPSPLRNFKSKPCEQRNDKFERRSRNLRGRRTRSDSQDSNKTGHLQTWARNSRARGWGSWEPKRRRRKFKVLWGILKGLK